MCGKYFLLIPVYISERENNTYERWADCRIILGKGRSRRPSVEIVGLHSVRANCGGGDRGEAFPSCRLLEETRERFSEIQVTSVDLFRGFSDLYPV